MDIEELREKMHKINNEFADDPEVCHSKLDDLLLEYINDNKVKELFEVIDKWYA